MTLELWNTFATFGTFAVIAATAIAAVVQLRHLRAGNQINAMISLGNQWDDTELRDARRLAIPNIASALENHDVQNYSLAVLRGLSRPPVPQEVIDLWRAASLIGNYYEELGILVKNGAIDADLVLDRWSTDIGTTWHRMAKFIAWNRGVEKMNSTWENFEYLAVLSEDWLLSHPDGTYPRGVRRLPMPEIPPIPA